MNEKPILFSAPMINAIWAGRKTMTRRVIHFPEGETGRLPDGGATNYLYYPGGIKYPNYNPGDILWVRETYFREACEPECAGRKDENECPFFRVGENCYGFKAQYATGEGDLNIKWHPSIFMPKQACRLFLRVIDVRAERLQDIASDDARDEGVDCSAGTSWTFSVARDCCGAGDNLTRYQAKFVILWDGLNAKRGYPWSSNPWVWVYTFERAEKPEGWCKG